VAAVDGRFLVGVFVGEGKRALLLPVPNRARKKIGLGIFQTKVDVPETSGKCRSGGQPGEGQVL